MPEQGGLREDVSTGVLNPVTWFLGLIVALSPPSNRSSLRALLLRAVGSLAAAVLVAVAGGCGGSEADRAGAPPGTPVPATLAPPPAVAAEAQSSTTSTPVPPFPTTAATESVAPAEPPTVERTPKPDRSADARRGPATGQPETRSGKPEKPPADATATVKDSKESNVSRASGGQEYTWHDGDRVRRITLESGLVVQPSSQNTASDIVTRDDGESSIVQRQAWHATSDTQPVFRSQSGQLLTLPGGVLLALDDAWDEARVNRFFSENGISTSNVEQQDWGVNAFFIRTKPGMPSLDLANRLAALEGVEISSPNWQTEVSTR